MSNRRFFIGLVLAVLVIAGAGCATHRATTMSHESSPAKTPGPLRVHPSNRRYFTDNSGRAINLSGSHVWTNLQDTGESDPPAPLDYNAHLDLLTGLGHNSTRGWATENPKWSPGCPQTLYHTPMPFARPGPELAKDDKPKFDVTQFNQEYFDRLRQCVELARARGMYMGIMLFNGWSIEDKKRPIGNPWPSHPFNKANNINGIDGDPDGDNEGFETHDLVVPAVTKVQEAYTAKVIDTLNDMDNIIWEISNESWEGSVKWQYHMIQFIHNYEKSKPVQHLVWMSGYMVPNQSLFDSPAEVISPCRKDGTNYRGDPPPTKGDKIIVLDTDHIWGVGGDYQWVWKSFTRGYHPIFMDPMYGLESKPKLAKNSPQWIGARKAMGYARKYADKIDLVQMTPQPDVCSTRFCLAHAGNEYVVYQPRQGDFTIKLEPGSYSFEWFDAKAGAEGERGQVMIKENTHTFVPPSGGDSVLWLKKTQESRHDESGS